MKNVSVFDDITLQERLFQSSYIEKLCIVIISLMSRCTSQTNDQQNIQADTLCFVMHAKSICRQELDVKQPQVFSTTLVK